VNNEHVELTNFETRPMREEDVHPNGVIDSMSFGACRPEYYREKLGSATKGAGIDTSLVAQARTTILQAECKRKEK
jgi:hypothetical protein